MKSQLTTRGGMPVWDASLMRALSQVSAPDQENDGMVIGIEDDAGAVYRIILTTGLCETVRLFESARNLGFAIAAGRTAQGYTSHRVLQRPRLQSQ